MQCFTYGDVIGGIIYRQSPSQLEIIFSRLRQIYLQALTLVGPTVTRPVLDPLAVINIDNQLYI